jgi:hypothetical protein
MAMIAKLSWKSNDDQVEARSLDEVLRIVREVDAECLTKRPIAMQIVRENGEMVMIVLGADRCCMDWFPNDYSGTGSYHTVAETFDPAIQRIPADPEVITYYFFGHHSEVPLECTVAKEEAFEAVREFIKSPGRPRSIRWALD